MTKEDKIKAITANLKQVQAVITSEVSGDDPAGLVEKLNKLVNISSLSTNNSANAKTLWRQEQKEAIQNISELELDRYPASTINEFIRAKCGDVEALYENCERTDKRLSYAIDSMRTCISLLKTEMENNLKT